MTLEFAYGLFFSFRKVFFLVFYLWKCWSFLSLFSSFFWSFKNLATLVHFIHMTFVRFNSIIWSWIIVRYMWNDRAGSLSNTKQLDLNKTRRIKLNHNMSNSWNHFHVSEATVYWCTVYAVIFVVCWGNHSNCSDNHIWFHLH